MKMNEYEIFQLALDIDEPAARRLFLTTACEQDGQLLSRVEALLASHDGHTQFLKTPAVEQIADLREASSDGKMLGENDSRSDEEPDATSLHPGGSKPMVTYNDDSDSETPLGYLEPSTKPGSLGRLAHYEVLEVVGRGAFGTVLRAFDEKLQRVVAIKVMALELAAISPARKRFMREAQASAAIRHENVVSVYAVEEKPLPYLVMEYIPGRTLQQQLNERGPLDVPTVLRLGRQIAEGLAAAHAQELIHRDVKPGNILLETSFHDRVKITDFGLARAADDASLTQSGTIAGTPMYMAPEQALGHQLDQRADLFSFGSVLYHSISGRPPFRAATALAVLKRVVDETPRPIREIIPETPQWLCDIITKLHAKNPDERYQSAREIADVLATCESQLHSQIGPKDFTLIAHTKMPTGTWWKRTAVPAMAILFLVIGLIAFNRRSAPLSVTGNVTPQLSMSNQPIRALTNSELTELGTQESEGWVQLFNGKDLTGWKFHPDHSGHWEVKDGILKGSQRQSYLFSQLGHYGDFHLRAEVKINLGGDSGILFRAPLKLLRGRTPREFGIPGCYEAELQENRSYSWRTGSVTLSTADAPPMILGKVVNNSLTHPDEWFTFEIIAENYHFITKVNGIETANCSDPLRRLQTGHLALQVWHPNTIVQFRKIEIKELPLSNALIQDPANHRLVSDERIEVIPLIDPQADKRDLPPRTKADVPRFWNDEDMKDLELPLSNAAASPRHVSAEYYYQIPEMQLYRSYPVYHPNNEPTGYYEKLLNTAPEIIWNGQQHPPLDSEANWIAAGELIFEMPILLGSGRMLPSTGSTLFVRDAQWYSDHSIPTTHAGVNPFYRYVVMELGKVEVGVLSCAMCHTRVMADGTALKGAQGNFPFGRVYAAQMTEKDTIPDGVRELEKNLFNVPWGSSDPHPEWWSKPLVDLAAAHACIPSGVLARHRSSPLSPVVVPDLFGLPSRRYLDRTGLQNHRGIEDLMRYVALNQGMDNLSQFGNFIPGGIDFRTLPEPADCLFRRYSDDQLYALAKYIYSLQPPVNPHPFDDQAKRGKQVFMTNGCARCHEPDKDYSSDRLVAAPGFEVPTDHPEKARVMSAARKHRRNLDSVDAPRNRILQSAVPEIRLVARAVRAQWFSRLARRLVRCAANRGRLPSNGVERTAGYKNSCGEGTSVWAAIRT